MTGVKAREPLWRYGALIGALLLAALAILLAAPRATAEAPTASADRGVHVGVGSCAGSTCHGRSEATGKIVRQDELQKWQEPSSVAGAHSRAWDILGGARGRAIAARLGIGDPKNAAMCIGCHADPAPTRGGGWRTGSAARAAMAAPRAGSPATTPPARATPGMSPTA